MKKSVIVIILLLVLLPIVKSDNIHSISKQKVSGIEPTTESIEEEIEEKRLGIGTSSYYYGTGLIAKEENGEISYYHTDNLGSTRAVTDKDGKVKENMNYLPYGQNLDNSEETFTFTGKELDSSSGLQYFGARYYDPSIGRFITLDPIGDGINWYSYAANNPIGYFDINGMYSSDPKDDDIYVMPPVVVTADRPSFLEKQKNGLLYLAYFLVGGDVYDIATGDQEQRLSTWYGVTLQNMDRATSDPTSLAMASIGGSLRVVGGTSAIIRSVEVADDYANRAARLAIKSPYGAENEFFRQFNYPGEGASPWKLHIGASSVDDASGVIDATVPILDDVGTTFKVVRNQEMLNRMVGTQQNKFITVYPSSIEQGADLSLALGRRLGPISSRCGSAMIQGEFNLGGVGRLFLRNEVYERGVAYAFRNIPKLYQQVHVALGGRVSILDKIFRR